MAATTTATMSSNNGNRKSPAPMKGGNSNNDLKRNANAASSSTSSGSGSGGERSMQVTSDELNILVYRYLQEAGFVHSAFTFAYESMVGKTNASKASIPPGALISFVQKGLQYIGIEETLRLDGTDRKSANGSMNGNSNQSEDSDADFSLLCPASIKSLIRKNPPIRLSVPPATAAAAIKARLESEAKAMESAPASMPKETKSEAGGGVSSGKSNSNTSTSSGTGSSRQNGQLPTPQASQIQNASYQSGTQPKTEQSIGRGSGAFGNGYAGVASASDKAAAAVALASFNSQGQQSSAMEIDTNSSNSNTTNAVHGFNVDPKAEAIAAAVLAGQTQHPPSMDVINNAAQAQQDSEIERADMLTRASPDEVLELNKHTSEVFMCAWNPIFTDLLATGSGDASARIWQMGGKNAHAGSGICRLLQHGSNSADIRNKDVTTLEWSSNGELLATGSYDGVARVWERTGANVHTLRGHVGPIFSLKWNKRGNYLLSGSYDKTTIVWDISGDTGVIKQQFNHHTAPALDVDWKDDVTFASCSTDKTVLICRVGAQKPLHQFTGHQDEVNAVKWDPTGTLLASCSDDSTAKVWDISKGSSNPLHDFTSHKQEIYTVKWSPTGPGSKNPTKPPMLATASFDGSVRLWNVRTGACISILSRHRDSVYSVAFSPSGDYLASGSLAGQLYVWRVKDGQHIKSFKGKGDIFEVAWNKEETRIAACFSSNVVNVIDFKA